MRFIFTFSCKDRIGIVAKVSTFLAKKQSFILELSQYGDLETGRFFMRCVFEYRGDPLDDEEFIEQITPLAKQLELTWKCHSAETKSRVLLLVSKESHCLNDLLHRMKTGTLPIEIPAIVSNHRDLAEIAAWYRIPFYHFPITPNIKAVQEKKILELIQTLQIDLTVLARYMQILSPSFVQKIFGQAINIHHSFLPSFKGAKPYTQAFERGVKIIGATAHYVSEELDEGPIIEQEVFRVDHTYSPSQLIDAGKDIESQVLARAVKYHTEHRIFLNGKKTVIFK